MVEDISERDSFTESFDARLRESLRLDESGCWAPKGHADWGPGKSLSRLRMMLNLSQSKIAWRSGIMQAQISQLEAGRDPRWSTLMRLAAAMECDAVFRLRPRRSLNEMRLENIKGFY
jgi:DNA-binding XRE family transcriptional regulator